MYSIIIVLMCLVLFISNCLCSYLKPYLKTSDYIKLKESPYFVDKTLLIYNILNDDEPLLLTAPKGFGKSSNLDMIKVFFSNTVDKKVAEDIFVGTDITKDGNFVHTHLGNYPVIHCSFESLSPVTDYNKMLGNFQTSLHRAFLQHQYLTSSALLARRDLDRLKKLIDVDSYTNLEPAELSSGLHFLAKILKIHHSKPVLLLVDDYDSVIWDSVLTKSLGIREVVAFYDTVLNEVMADKDVVKKSILTGTSCILSELLPCLKNIKCVKFLHDRNFESYFGLTDDEVDNLADRSLYVQLRPNLTEWYDGYTSPDLSVHMYNTKSVLNFFVLSRGELKSFWKHEKIQKSLKVLLEDNVRKNLLLDNPESLIFVVRDLTEINEGVLEGVKKMIDQEIWDANVSHMYIHLLMEQGYFTFDKHREKSGHNSLITLKLANLDICGSLQKFIVDSTHETKRQTSNVIIV